MQEAPHRNAPLPSVHVSLANTPWRSHSRCPEGLSLPSGGEPPRRWVAPELYVQAVCCVVHPKPLWGKALVRTLPFVRLRHQSGFLETLIKRTDYLVSRYKWNLCQFYVSLSMLTGLCPTTGYRHGLLTNKSEGVEPSPRRTSPLPLMRNRTALLAWYRQICRYHQCHQLHAIRRFTGSI